MKIKLLIQSESAERQIKNKTKRLLIGSSRQKSMDNIPVHQRPRGWTCTLSLIPSGSSHSPTKQQYTHFAPFNLISFIWIVEGLSNPASPLQYLGMDLKSPLLMD